MYKVTKVIDGFSTAFRQWKATSHCRFIHGYALTFDFEFCSRTLDDHNWVVDFGGLKRLKERLVEQFDHTTAVAIDDPFMFRFQKLATDGIIDMRVMPRIGCEAFAEWAFHAAEGELLRMNVHERVWVSSVTVHEHGKNSASYINDQPNNQPLR